MFKTLKLAREAKRASEILDEEGFADEFTLVAKVRAATEMLVEFRDKSERLHSANARNLDRAAGAEALLAVANAKIERMTSGLRRGSTKPTN